MGELGAEFDEVGKVVERGLGGSGGGES